MTGSSPRVRGSLLNFFLKFFFRGIIPAGAGLTSYTLVDSGIDWDHPRGCGAHSDPDAGEHAYEGSSPRVRGSLPTSRCQWRPLGIIPAGAGLT